MVSGNEPLLLEYNCRFGDPETQAILPRLDSDLLEVLVKCADGKLGSSNLKWDNSKSVCVVLASRGYPETSSKDDLINGLDLLENNGCYGISCRNQICRNRYIYKWRQGTKHSGKRADF